MKFVSKVTFLIIALCLNFLTTNAQEQSYTNQYKEDAIQKLSQLMNDFYVFPDVAKKTEAHLIKQLNEGHFNQFKNDEDFAAALTESVQSINKDKHMRIWQNKPYEAPDNTPERMIEEKLDRVDRSRRSNFGFNSVQILEGNVGYLDLRSFAGFQSAKEVVDSYMKLMSNSDAIIIDLSKNGGGDPEMVQYLCSFFFDKKVHLNSLYFRQGDRTIEFWTLDKIGGEKMPDIPLFVITSNKTFSGAEEFSYNMQTQKRATLVGQTTGGGANPGGSMSINNNLSVFIPGGMAINPITKTNWEGVGVVPEIKTVPEETFDKTYDLAKNAADAYRAKMNKKYTQMFIDLNNTLENYTTGDSDTAILEGLKSCLENSILQEWEINILGYDYLIQHNKPKVAESIFKANTLLHPNSANVFDSYAEALMMNGNIKASVDNYRKAVKLATDNEEGELELFKENLHKAEQKLKN